MTSDLTKTDYFTPTGNKLLDDLTLLMTTFGVLLRLGSEGGEETKAIFTLYGKAFAGLQGRFLAQFVSEEVSIKAADAAIATLNKLFTESKQ